MSCDVLLAPGGRTKLIKFMAEAATDEEHKDVALIIDGSQKCIKISNHINVSKKPYISYKWTILEADTNVYRELIIPAKGLSNILEKLDSALPVLFSISDENVITIANFHDTQHQPSLFDDYVTDLSSRNKRSVQYDLKAKATTYIGAYELPIKSPNATFQLHAAQFSRQLALITDLRKGKGDEHLSHTFILSVEREIDNKGKFTLSGRKTGWVSSLACEVDTEITGYFEIVANVNSLSMMRGLLSKVSGNVSVRFCENHIVISKETWLCAFKTDTAQWNARSNSAPVTERSLTNFVLLPKMDLVDYLPKLNTADDEKQGDLNIEYGPDDLLNLRVEQDNTQARVSIPIYCSFFQKGDGVSVSLWLLQTILNYYPSKVFWGYEKNRECLFFTDEKRENQFILSGKRSSHSSF